MDTTGAWLGSIVPRSEKVRLRGITKARGGSGGSGYTTRGQATIPRASGHRAISLQLLIVTSFRARRAWSRAW